jgi:hypothetical protein
MTMPLGQDSTASRNFSSANFCSGMSQATMGGLMMALRFGRGIIGLSQRGSSAAAPGADGGFEDAQQQIMEANVMAAQCLRGLKTSQHNNAINKYHLRRMHGLGINT